MADNVPKDILTQIIKSAGQGCVTNTILQNCNTALPYLQFLVSETKERNGRSCDWSALWLASKVTSW